MHAAPHAQYCAYIQAAVLYIRWQILELPNRIIVLESDFTQTLAPLCDPNATFEHLRQMMSPL